MSEKNTDKSRATGHAPIDFQPFHSAVNRIPLLRKKAKSLGDKAWNRKQKHRTRGQLTREQTGFERERTVARNAVGPFAKTIFHDGVAEGHDLLKPDRWSGSIDVEMTVHTPLVYGGQDDNEEDDAPGDQRSQKNRKDEDRQKGNDHKRKSPMRVPTYPAVHGQASTDCSGDSATDIENVSQKELPFMSPTMVKGMISRAYETLTASRFRVFGSQSPDAGTDHRTRLTYRVGRSKKTYERSPWDLAKDQWALPLSKAKEASAADRLFGYVIQKNNERGNPEETDPESAPSGTALQGRLTFGPVKILGPRPNPQKPPESAIETLGGPHPLPPLLEPKPSSARRFITNKAGYTPTVDPGSAPAKGKAMKPIHRKDYFKKGQFLGITAYPIHRDVVCANAKSPVTRAGKHKGNQLPGTPSNKRGGANTNVTIDVLSFIKVGSTLYCRLDFTNLVPEELAALLWVLTPENLVPQSERSKRTSAERNGSRAESSAIKPPVGYLRMGLGKPLGLGVIETRATSVTAYKGEDLAEKYRTLDGCLGCMPESSEPDQDIERFSELLKGYELDKQPWVQAMQRAAYGYDDSVEVRYMSLKENKKNNQTDASSTNTAKGKAMWSPEKSLLKGQGLSPVDLFGSNAVYALKIEKLDSLITHQSSQKQKVDKKNRNKQEGNKSDTKIQEEIE